MFLEKDASGFIPEEKEDLIVEEKILWLNLTYELSLDTKNTYYVFSVML